MRAPPLSTFLMIESILADMTRKIKLTLAVAGMLMLTGCSTMGTIAKHLSKDGAIVHVDVAKQTLTRVGTTTNQVEVSNGNITINPSK